MKIAVTGYRGFISSHLLPEIRGEQLSLIEQDDYPPNERVEGTDAVIHLGAIAGANPDISPYEYFEYNVKRTVDLLEAARLAKTKRFIFISTCAVSLGVRNIYDVTKLQAEQWCEAYRGYLDDIVILRLYNVYGEGDSKSVVAKFVSAVKKGTPLVIHGTGKQTRDFIFVKDVVRAIKKVLYSGEMLNRSFEIGTGQEKSVSELVNMIFLISGKKVPIEYGPLPYKQLEKARCPEPLFVENPVRLKEGLKLLLRV